MMWTCKNANELVDLKLLTIQFVRKIWLILLITIVGGLLTGGIYTLTKLVVAPEPSFESISKFYIEYAMNEEGVEMTHFNSYTWEDLIKMDLILDVVSDEMKTTTTKEVLKEAIEATLLSDERILTITTTTSEKELTEEIARAAEQGLIIFGDIMEESESIKVIDSQIKATEVKIQLQLGRAVTLGAIISFILSIIMVILYFVLDDSIYIPTTFSKRYGLAVIGSDIELEELNKNMKYLNEKYKVIKEVSIGSNFKSEDMNIDDMIQADGIILKIKAGKRNGTMIEKAISQLSFCEATIVGAILMETDKTLWKWYYLAKKEN